MDSIVYIFHTDGRIEKFDTEFERSYVLGTQLQIRPPNTVVYPESVMQDYILKKLGENNVK